MLPKQAQQLEDDIRNGPTTLANTEQEVLRAFEWSNLSIYKYAMYNKYDVLKYYLIYSISIELKLQDIVEIICHRLLYRKHVNFLNGLLYNL